MPATTIEVEQLGKRYRLGRHTGQYETLRSAIARLGQRQGSERRASEIWALRDVGLQVDEGEAIGVIGRNGAGKTTLLKILARITEPTLGLSRTRGHVGSLLEVGTGFHSELTGRDNVYLNGAILGMSRADIRRRFDEIVDFAGVAPFLDTPLKRYSAGMQLRLAFSIAAHLEPDIVLVDEVLAVGDVEFQQKCLGRMSELENEGRTVIFVSHDLSAIRRLCPRSIWLDGGRVAADGPTPEVVERYLASHATSQFSVELPVQPDQPVQLFWVGITDADRAPFQPRRNEPFSVRARFHTTERVPDLDVAIYLQTDNGVSVIDETWQEVAGTIASWNPPQDLEATIHVPPVLAPGDYVVGVWCATAYDEFFFGEVFRFRLGENLEESDLSPGKKRLVRCAGGLQLRAI
jgi:ABC-2 type transport system ATP-binding protein/lipopolysaccharide transport system ATP-binding protein